MVTQYHTFLHFVTPCPPVQTSIQQPRLSKSHLLSIAVSYQQRGHCTAQSQSTQYDILYVTLAYVYQCCSAMGQVFPIAFIV